MAACIAYGEANATPPLAFARAAAFVAGMRRCTLALVMARALPGVVFAAALAACSSADKHTPAISWRAPPATSPGAIVRTDDQAEPRLESLPPPAPKAAPRPASGPTATAELNQAAELSAKSNERYAAGDLTGAIKAQQEALAIRERILPAGDPDIAATLTSLGRLEALHGDYAAAEPLLRRALTMRETDVGKNEPAIAESLSNLALVYAAQGRYGEAEPLYQRAIDILDTPKNPDPEALATVLENYAALLSDSGRPEGAKALEARAAALRKNHALGAIK
jgi:tetratricopeptide (TPR) repeat protein